MTKLFVPHDVFISYASGDKSVAFAACAALEQRAIRCWIAPRDVVAGKDFAEEIVTGIEECKVFVLIFSSASNHAEYVKCEVERAVSKGKVILPFRVQDVPISKGMQLFLSTRQWLDAISPPLESHLSALGDTVSFLLNNEAPPPQPGRSSGFEFRSRLKCFGIPLVHLASARTGKSEPRGILAVGGSPRGIISIGYFPVGVIAMGTVPVGVIAIGFFPMGVFSAGAVAIGICAGYGVVSAAPVALGCVALGYYANGMYAAGSRVLSATIADPEAVKFFTPWVKPWFHAMLIALFFLSYMGRKLGLLIGRTVVMARDAD